MPATAQPGTTPAPQPPPVAEPEHPLDQLTTWELRNYRQDLEHALGAIPADVPVARAQLTARLAAVSAEQDDRAKIRAAR
jgi:hypothetical protein